MTILKVQLDTLTIRYGDTLYKYPRPVLGSAVPALPPDIDWPSFVRDYPPIFVHENNDAHVMVGRHLSFLILSVNPDIEATIDVRAPVDCSPHDLEQLAVFDRYMYAGLATAKQYSSRNRVTPVKYRFHAAGQICPLCALGGRRVKLAASQIWKSLLKEKGGDFLHCTTCPLRVEVTTEELRRFIAGDFPTSSWLTITRDGENPVACAGCAVAGRTGIILTRTSLDGTQVQCCSNQLRNEPTCLSGI